MCSASTRWDTGGFKGHPEPWAVAAHPHQTLTAGLPWNEKDLSHKGRGKCGFMCFKCYKCLLGSCWRLSHCGGTQQIWIGSLCLAVGKTPQQKRQRLLGSLGVSESASPCPSFPYLKWRSVLCLSITITKAFREEALTFLQHTCMPWGSCCGAVDITESLLGQKKWICVTCISRLQLIYLNKFSTFLPSCFLSASFSMELFQRMLSCFFPLFHSHCTPTDSQISLVNAYLPL